MKREVEPQTENKTEDFKNNEDFQAIEKILAQEIAEGQVEVKVEDEKIVVELVSPASSGAEGEVDNGSKEAGIIDQKTVDMFAKVAEAQSQIESEIVVKDTTADQAKSGEREGDVKQIQVLLVKPLVALERSRTSMNSWPGSVWSCLKILKKDWLKSNVKVIRLLSDLPNRIVPIGEAADIQPGFEPLLNRVGNALSTTEGPVTVEGHTDNVPIAFSDRFQSIGIYQRRGLQPLPITCSEILKFSRVD